MHRRECSPVIPKDCTVKLTPASGKNAFSDATFDEVSAVCNRSVLHLLLSWMIDVLLMLALKSVSLASKDVKD